MKMMMIVFLLLVSQHASGVEVYEGVESVLLPCQVPADVSRNSTSAVWDRDGFKNPTVHLRRQKSDDLYERDDLSGQNDLYKHRTSMRANALQTGDLSLTLKNPTVSDSGTYTCTAVSYGDRLSRSEVQLKVSEPPPVWPKVLSAVLGTLIILAAAFGLFVCCAYKRMKDREALQPEVVVVPKGENSVLLPFKTTADLPQDVTVEWKRSDCSDTKVHVYESGNNQPVKQDQGFRGRTEMKKDPLRNKDLSLTLKDLRLTDSGPYTCTIYDKVGDMLMEKVVTLRFDDMQPELLQVEHEDKFVLLPFKTTAVLPQDVTVEWTLNLPKHMMVHVYESGKHQPDKQDQDYRGRTEMDEDPLRTKNLSLTLKKPHFTDRGVYTCTVYNKDGDMLRQKVVFLGVRVPQSEEVENKEGENSVVLPFKTTAVLPQDVTVEWRDSKNLKVHVYESGNNHPDKQDEHYRGHTEMGNKDPVRNKDLSLTLKHLRLTDSGDYTCTVYNKDGDMLMEKVVKLSVRALQTKEVEVKELKQGVKSVLLPFKTTADLPQDVTVEWTLTEPKHMKVHVYKSENKTKPDKQDQGYRGRTEMNEDPLRNKDLSLTLKYPQTSHSGVYTCTVYNKDGCMLLQKSVNLSVTALQPEMLKLPLGYKPVQLHCKTTADLPQDVTVEWRHNNMKVHVYESGNNYPDKQDEHYRGRAEMRNKDPLRNKDLSLTLKDLRLTDSGVYTCTVYNKDRNKLLQKSVTLSVTATLKGTMAELLSHHLCSRQRRGRPAQEHRNRNHEEERLTAEETV